MSLSHLHLRNRLRLEVGFDRTVSAFRTTVAVGVDDGESPGDKSVARTIISAANQAFNTRPLVVRLKLCK